MRLSLSRLVILALALLCTRTTYAQSEVYVVIHIDTVPSSVSGPSAVDILRQWSVETKKEAGCTRFEVLQQSDRGNHFTVVGVWKDQKTFDEHEAAAHTAKFRQLIQPLLGSPFDERLHHILQ